LDTNASPAEVWDRAFEVAQTADRQAESELLEQVITLAHKGGAGSIGLNDTLAALKEGRVYHLLVDKDLRAAGRLCPNCGAVVIENRSQCPYCETQLTTTNDAVNVAIQQAVGAGLHVTVIGHDARLAEVGGIAAVLRY
jgi:peptide subunit release factor 1 (eRF1)